MELNTINVIEINTEKLFPDIIGLSSFDNPKEAEELFEKIALKNGAKKEDIDYHIENGYFENGTYTLLLVHSFTLVPEN